MVIFSISSHVKDPGRAIITVSVTAYRFLSKLTTKRSAISLTILSGTICITIHEVIANEPAERRRSAGEAAENSAARRIAYAKKFSIGL